MCLLKQITWQNYAKKSELIWDYQVVIMQTNYKKWQMQNTLLSENVYGQLLNQLHVPFRTSKQQPSKTFHSSVPADMPQALVGHSPGLPI